MRSHHRDFRPPLDERYESIGLTPVSDFHQVKVESRCPSSTNSTKKASRQNVFQHLLASKTNFYFSNKKYFQIGYRRRESGVFLTITNQKLKNCGVNFSALNLTIQVVGILPGFLVGILQTQK